MYENRKADFYVTVRGELHAMWDAARKHGISDCVTNDDADDEFDDRRTAYISFGAKAFRSPPLHKLLNVLAELGGRAEFWVRISTLGFDATVNLQRHQQAQVVIDQAKVVGDVGERMEKAIAILRGAHGASEREEL